MQITLDVPDDLAGLLTSAGQAPSRAALEAMALEAYRMERLTPFQLRRLLGLSRYDLDGFFKEHNVFEYTFEDFEQDIAHNASRGRKAPAPGFSERQ